MTRQANRNDIEPMFLGIAKVMMVLGSWFRAVNAPQSLGGGNSAFLNCTAHCTPGSYLVYVFPVKAFFASLAFLGTSKTVNSISKCLCFLVFTTIGCDFIRMLSVVSANRFFARIGLLVFTLACLATGAISAFLCSIFVKLRNGLNFFAFATLFVYDGFKHDCLLLINSCVRAICGHDPAGGLFHYRDHSIRFNQKTLYSRR